MGKEVIDITPRLLGAPHYPAGLPLQPWEIEVEGVSLRDMILEYYEDKLDEKKLVYLKQYIKYRVNAPLFDNELTQELREIFNTQLLSVEEMVDACLDHGLDPI